MTGNNLFGRPGIFALLSDKRPVSQLQAGTGDSAVFVAWRSFCSDVLLTAEEVFHSAFNAKFYLIFQLIIMLQHLREFMH